MDRLFQPVAADREQQVGILLVPAFSSLTLAAITEPLRVANRSAARRLYHAHLLSEHGGPVVSSSGLAVTPARALADEERFDLFFVVASFDVVSLLRQPIVRRLRRAARRCGIVGGLESGPYLLAQAGLLEGRKATTHWEDLEDFAGRFPDVKAVNERFVVDGDRVTTSGAVPTLDFVMNMIRHQHGLLMALDVGSSFIYEQDTAPADPQRILSLGSLRWSEPRLSRAVEAMEANLGEPLPIAALAGRAGLTERALQRLFRRKLDHTPQQVYLWLRLNAARRLLAHTELPLSEVADACGFASRVAFHRAFKRAFDQAPGAFRRGQ